MNYGELVKVYEELDSTSKRLEKTFSLAVFLMKVPKEQLPVTMLLIEGKAYPDFDPRKIGVASQLILKCLAAAAGLSQAKIEELWKKTGDLGDVAQKVMSSKKQATLSSTTLTASKVLANIQKLASMEGQGSVDRKIGLIVELLSSATGAEAKYLVRTVLEQLRVGSGAGTIRDSIAWAYFPHIEGITDERLKTVKRGKTLRIEAMPELPGIEKYAVIEPSNEALGRELYNKILDLIQQAYDLTNDWGRVAKAASDGVEALQRIELTVGIPIKVMLAIKADTITEALESTGIPAACEYKYDGFRMQVHKDKQIIKLFTRRLEDVTRQFPEVVTAAREQVNGSSYIIDCEAIGYDPMKKKYLSFQNISQRIKRKHGIEGMAAKFPVELNVFDIISYEGKSMLAEPFRVRRALVESIVRSKERSVQPSKYVVASTPAQIEKFFRSSLSHGNEGIMLKNLEAPYQPGARVGHMVKYKPVMENLDLVIVGAEWGEGKRSAWLASFIVACRDGNEFLEIGRVGTGFKEKEEEGFSFSQLTELLRPHFISEESKVVKIKPKIVIEVSYEEIQRSTAYSSGYALRFPRLFRLREDRGPKDCSTLDDVQRLYFSQKKAV